MAKCWSSEGLWEYGHVTTRVRSVGVMDYERVSGIVWIFMGMCVDNVYMCICGAGHVWVYA